MNPIAERIRAATTPLTALDLAYTPAGPHLSELDGLAELHTLKLGYAGVDAAALVTLGSLSLPGLRLLDLMGLGLRLTRAAYEARARANDGDVPAPVTTAAMLRPLLASTWIDGLQTLVLSHSSLDASACRALGRAALPSLETLVLIGTSLGDPAGLLAGHKPSLRWIEGGPIPPTAVLRSPVLGQLTHLRVQLRKPTDDAVASIVAGMPLARELRLNHVGGGPRALAALAASIAPLERLDLRSNELSDAAVAPLWGAGWVPTMRALSLDRNELGDPSLDALLAAPWPDGLALGLRENRLSEAGWKRLADRFGAGAIGDGTQRPPLPRAGVPVAGRFSLTAVEGPAPFPPFHKLPAAVKALGLALEPAAGASGWYVGVDDEGAVLVSSRGARVPMAPAPEVPLGDPLAVVDSDAGVAFILVMDEGIHRVGLATGEVRQVGVCVGRPHGAVCVPGGVAVLYGSPASGTTVEIFRTDGTSAGCAHGLAGRYDRLAAQDDGRLLVVGVAEYGSGPATVIEVADDGRPTATPIPGAYTLVGLPDRPLLEAGPALYAVTRAG